MNQDPVPTPDEGPWRPAGVAAGMLLSLGCVALHALGLSDWLDLPGAWDINTLVAGAASAWVPLLLLLPPSNRIVMRSLRAAVLVLVVPPLLLGFMGVGVSWLFAPLVYGSAVWSGFHESLTEEPAPMPIAAPLVSLVAGVAAFVLGGLWVLATVCVFAGAALVKIAPFEAVGAVCVAIWAFPTGPALMAVGVGAIQTVRRARNLALSTLRAG